MVLGITGVIGILYNYPQFLAIAPQRFIASLDVFPLLAVPLFILAGQLLGVGGIAERIVRMAMVFVGRIPGGLGLVSIVATMFFSGCSGSSSADTAAIGSLTLPVMEKQKYTKELASAIVATAGATGALVPPSIDMIIVGIIASISIGGLFAGGFIPAAVNALGVMALVYYYGLKMNLPLAPRMTMKEKLLAIWGGAPAIGMMVIILGGIIGGVFTPTEASAVAVLYGFCLSVLIYRELKLKDLPRLLLRTAELTGIVLIVVGMASVLSFVLTYERIPYHLAQFVIDNFPTKFGFLIAVNVIFLFTGCMMDTLPALIVLLPILTPVSTSLGINPLHFGIVIVANVGLGMATPPVGILLYVACGISKLPLDKIIRPVLPFLFILIGTLLVITYVPEITLFLPRLLGYVGG
jgi:C4-dicarboxylate transporter DctM subunit